MMVQTEKPFYEPGEQVNGKVFLQLGQTVQAKYLSIEIKGKEKCKFNSFRTEWHDGEHEGDPKVAERIKEKHKETKNFLEGKVEFSGSEMAPGNYEAMFYFKLPNECPSSFYYENKKIETKPLAKTVYTVKAKLDLSGDDDFKYKTTLMIREKNEKEKTEVKEKDRDNIKTWCCIDQGHSEMKVEFNKTVFTPQDKAIADCKIDNSECKIDCKEVKLEILMSGKICIDGHEEHIEQCLPKAHKSCEGPKAGEKWDEKMEIDLSKIKYEPTLQKKGKDGKKKNTSEEDRWMMSQVQPATRNAKYFKMRYYANVKTTFDGCTCDETPDCDTPMTIVPMVNPAMFGFQPPAGY